MKYGFVSVDDHVQETPDLWKSRMSKKWGDRVPQLISSSKGPARWVVDGELLLEGKVAAAGAVMADRSAEPTRWEDVPAAAYNPQERLKAMDASRVDYSVLFPTVAGQAGEAFNRLKDQELGLACIQAYNDWLLEEWASVSDRFIPQCIVPVWPPDETVKEMERSVAKGHRGVIFPALPMDLRDVPHVSEPEYDRVWSACEELNVPLCLHAGSSPKLQYEAWDGLSPKLAQALNSVTKPVSSVYVLGLYLFSRILMRHPKLRLIMTESALSWGMLYLEWADHQFEHDGLQNEGYDRTPSQMFRDQCFFNGWYDDVSSFSPYIGEDSIVWSTNFPMTNSTWPRTEEFLARCFKGVSEQGREKVLWKNAADLYRI